MYITYSEVSVEHLLRTKHRRLIIEVIVCPRADGGRPSDGHQDDCFLAELQNAKPVDDEVQAS